MQIGEGTSERDVGPLGERFPSTIPQTLPPGERSSSTMPPRKAAATKSGSKGAAATKSGSKGAPKKRVAAIGFKLPDPIAPGLVVKDVAKQSWKIGKSIG